MRRVNLILLITLIFILFVAIFTHPCVQKEYKSRSAGISLIHKNRHR